MQKMLLKKYRAIFLDFEVSVKILKTVLLFALCSIIFIVLIVKEYTIIAYIKIKSKMQKDNDIEELDEYSAREEIVLPDKVEPGELDKLDKVRKWMW